MPASFNMTPQQIKRLADDIDASGFARLPGALSPAELQHLRDYTQGQAHLHQGEYFAHHGEQSLTGCPLSSIWEDPEFKTLLARLYHHGFGAEPTSQQIFPVLRCVQGNQGQRESNSFHFDASLVTVLVPIFIPGEAEQRGDLMLFPNLRKAHRNVLVNVAQKAFVQNRLIRRLIVIGINRGWLKPRTLPLVPGDIYLFWGYRTLHANQACSPNITRATAIFHFGDPHAGSLSTRLILRLNQRRARRASRRAGPGPGPTLPTAL